MPKELNAKQILANKMAGVKPHTQTTQMTTAKVTIGSLWNRLGQTTKKNFKQEVISLSTILKEKLQFLTAGKPLLTTYESKSDEFKINEFSEELGLQEMLFAAIGYMFEYGGAYFVWDTIKGKTQLRLADPNFPNVIRRMGKVAYEAEIWTAFKFERAQYWKHTRYTRDTIYNDVYEANDAGDPSFNDKKKVNLEDFNKKVGNPLLAIAPETPNTLKFIPVELMTYVPTANLSTGGIKALAPKKRLDEIQVMLNEGTAALRLELFLNRTKMLIDQDLIDATSEGQMAKVAQENIIGVVSDSGNADGSNKVVEVMQGDPKVEQYWTNITNIISLAVQALKLSELTSEESTTATDAIFSKGNDVETVNALSVFYQKSIARILEKSKAIQDKTAFEEWDIDTSKWGVQIIPNVIMNEAKLTDIVIAQLGAGLLNMTQAKAKLENISPSDAEELLSEEEQFVNPTLEATSSFNKEDDEEAPEENPQKANEPKPEGAEAKK